MNTNDDILFDRLVDGELTSAERRTLLASLDARRDGWRKCALAFLEAQSWREHSRAILAEPQPAAPASQSVQTVDADKESPAPTTTDQRISIKSASAWLAIAAALLVAFRVGSMQRGNTNQVAGATPNDHQVATTPPNSPPAPQVNRVPKNPSDALNLWVRDDSGQLRRVRVPLVDANALDPDLGLQFQTGVPDDVRNQLQQQGYAVKSQRKFAPMWLENGRPMIVPVEDTKIVPVSNKVY
ncbi:MAG: hypothetical protein U0805_15340 [Pirellulales bacterium]